MNPTGDHFAVDNIKMYWEELILQDPITTENTSYTFTGLTPESNYYVTVTGVCGDEQTEASDTLVFVTPPFTQTIELLGGAWNWVSFYVETSDPTELLQMLESNAGNHVSQIESAYYGINIYDASGWWNEFDALTYEDMYLIEANDDCTIVLQGDPVDPANYPITIYPQQWNWIGFPCAEVVNLEVALAGFPAEEEDQLEGPEGLTMYSGGEWFEPFDMTPGHGYLYWSNSPAGSTPKTLTIQTGTTTKNRNVSMGKKALNLKATNKTDKGSVKAERVKNVMCKTYNQ